MGRQLAPVTRARNVLLLFAVLGLLELCVCQIKDELNFKQTSYLGSEANDVEVCVIRSRIDSSPFPADLPIEVTSTDGTAVALQSDYRSQVSKTYDFEGQAHTVSFPGMIIDDNIAEATECFTLSLTSGDTNVGIVGANSTTEICITDNDDEEAPQISCPANITENTTIGQSYYEAPIPALNSSSDNSGVELVISVNVGSDSPSVGELYQFAFALSPHTLTYTARDLALNPVTCVTIITVEDHEMPKISCDGLQFITAVTAGNYNRTIPAPEQPIITDNVDGSSLVAVINDSSTTFVIGEHVLRYDVQDSAMNPNSCTFLVTVEDKIRPIFDAKLNDIMNTTLSGQPYALVYYELPTASDNSLGVVTVECDPPSGGSFAIDVTRVMCFARDPSRSVQVAIFTVTVEDEEMPNITCPDNMTVFTDLHENFATLQIPDLLLSTDNSGISPTVIIEVNGTLYNISDSVELDLATRDHLLHYMVSDGSLNCDTCDVLITVSDIEPPELTCPDNIKVGTSTGLRNGTAFWFEPNITDNSMQQPEVDQSAESNSTVFPIGIHEVLYNATDGSGNTNNCTFTVEIEGGIITAPKDGTITTLIAVICVVAVIVIVLAFLIYYMRTHRSSKPQQTIDGQEMTSYDNDITTNEPMSSFDYEIVGVDKPAVVETSSPLVNEDVGLSTWAQHWNIPWASMIVGDTILGEGFFGEVRDGAVMIKKEILKAAIKKLKTIASSTEGQNFMEEFRTMTKIGSHPNVVGILGACEHEDVLYVALEYLPNGDLRSYLRSIRSTDNDSETSLTAEKMIQYAFDVANGMNHLSTSGVIHRDLAARNILLGNELVAKVSDFGLSRGEDVYVQKSKTRVPTRWLSLESLTHQIYTTKSDVWSFGILLWEIATFGGTPYPDITNHKVGSKLMIGYRMPKPTNCDDDVYDVMLQCWQEDPNKRPSFKELISIFYEMTHNTCEHTYFMQISPTSEEYAYADIHPDDD